MAISPGAQFDRYEIISLLGKGGMGEVYLAQDTRLRRKVALKLLPAQLTQDADRIRRFEQEAYAKRMPSSELPGRTSCCPSCNTGSPVPVASSIRSRRDGPRRRASQAEIFPASRRKRSAASAFSGARPADRGTSSSAFCIALPDLRQSSGKSGLARASR